MRRTETEIAAENIRLSEMETKTAAAIRRRIAQEECRRNNPDRASIILAERADSRSERYRSASMRQHPPCSGCHVCLTQGRCDIPQCDHAACGS